MDVGKNGNANIQSENSKSEQNNPELSKAIQSFTSLAEESYASVKNIPVNGLTKKVVSGVAVDQACPECGLSLIHI